MNKRIVIVVIRIIEHFTGVRANIFEDKSTTTFLSDHKTIYKIQLTKNKFSVYPVCPLVRPIA